MEKKTPDKNSKETPDKNPEGRPYGLTPEVVLSSRYYLENWQNLDKDDIIPSIEGLAYYLDVSRKTLYNWANDEKNVEFLHIFEKIKVKQAKVLISNGLRGDFNSAITKLMLTKHDYRDAKDERHADPNGDPLKINVIQYANNDTIQVPTETSPTGVSTEQSKIQDSSVSQKGGEVDSSSERTDKESSDNT